MNKYSKENIFYKIINKQIPSKFLYEDPHLIVIDDINPKASIHMLVIPKKPFVNISALIAANNASLLNHCINIADKMAAKRGAENSYKLLINNGRKAGQEIFHLHFHVLCFT